MGTELFGSSGVRGTVNAEVTAQLAVKMGLAAATCSKARTAIVARDTRVSGQMLEDAVVSGLISAGARVFTLGVTPTPVLAYSIKQFGADVGVMITASHNPPQYNGLKLFGADGTAYEEESQRQVERMIRSGEYSRAEWRDLGEPQCRGQELDYPEAIERAVRLRSAWNIIVDPGGGATFHLAPLLLKKIGCKVLAVNAHSDGSFSSRNSEPNAETLSPLARVTKALGADLALAFDGDGDRVAFIDDCGNFVDFDRVLAAYSGYVVKNAGGGVVVTNVEASMSVEKMVEEQGGRVVRTKVGDIYVSDAIKRNKAVFGGEPCGAWIHPDFNMCPDGVYSAIMLLRALESESTSLSEFVAKAPMYPILRENVGCSNAAKRAVVEGIAERLKSSFPNYRDIVAIDGIRLALREGWVLLRASGTEPLLRLTVEGESPKAAGAIMEKALSVIRDFVESVEP